MEPKPIVELHAFWARDFRKPWRVQLFFRRLYMGSEGANFQGMGAMLSQENLRKLNTLPWIAFRAFSW